VILTDKDRRLICLWLAGWKSESIASEIGMAAAKVRERARKVGLPKRISRPRNLWPSIVAWARNGHDAMAIARGIQCTKPEVIAECGDAQRFDVKQPRKPVDVAIRSKASKRAWATRRRLASARKAASAASEPNRDAAA
jgi:hypothetical protein